MSIWDWFWPKRTRLVKRRQRRFRSAWRLAKNAVNVSFKEGHRTSKGLQIRAEELVRSYQFNGFVNGLIINLAIALISSLIKLILNCQVGTGQQSQIDSQKLAKLSGQVEEQIAAELALNVSASEMATSVPNGSIPEVLEVLADLFQVLARLWDLLDGDED